MAQAYNAIIATITVASDASQVVKTMVKSTQWREGTSGTWLSTDCTLNANTTYQFRTPLSGMNTSLTAILPNIKASVAVDWDTTATPISTLGDYFMYNYARSCTSLTSLSVPDTSGLTSIGDYFMYSYAYGCTSLTSLSVPDTSGLTSVEVGFMVSYAYGCTSLTSLSVPDTSGLTSVGTYFMNSYAQGCSNLTSLSVPDTSGFTSVGTNFMGYYARSCTNLTSLSVPDTSGLISVGNNFMLSYAQDCISLTSLILPVGTGWFGSYDVNWSVPSGRLGYLYGYTPDSTSQTAWRALTVSGKTLYTNYIRSVDNVIISSTGTEADSERGLYVAGYSTSNSTRGLYLQGSLTSNSTRGLYIEGLVDTLYSRESSASLKADDSNLSIMFSEQDYTDVATDDDTFVDLEGTAQYFQLLFKEPNGNENNTDDFKITWKGKSSLAPSSSTVYLQIYNRDTESWTTLDSDDSTGANTKFTLESTVNTNLSDYYDANYLISCRVYQDVN